MTIYKNKTFHPKRYWQKTKFMLQCQYWNLALSQLAEETSSNPVKFQFESEMQDHLQNFVLDEKNILTRREVYAIINMWETCNISSMDLRHKDWTRTQSLWKNLSKEVDKMKYSWYNINITRKNKFQKNIQKGIDRKQNLCYNKYIWYARMTE